MATTQPGLGYKGALLLAGEEATWGTEVPRTDGTCLTSESLGAEEDVKESDNINASFLDVDEVYRAKITAGGDFEFEPRYEGGEIFFKHAFGSHTITEDSTFTVSSSNKYFDFDIGAAELNATVAEASYPMGTSQATSGSLCEAIYNAIVAAEAVGVYTVTFSQVTKKITIDRSTGSFSILWKTGVHGSDNSDDHIGTLIGYDDTADDSGSLSYVADNAVVTVHSHVFAISDTILEGLSLEKWIDTSLTTGKTLLYTGARINSMDLSIEPGGLLMCSVNVMAKEEELEETETSLTLSTVSLIPFYQAVFLYNAGAEAKVTAFNVTLNNILDGDRLFLSSNNVGQPIPNDKREVTGSFTVEFDDATKYNDFRNNTTRDINLKFTGGEIKSGSSYEFEIDLNQIKCNGSSPQISDEGVITQEIPFKAYAADSSNREIIINMKNTKASI